MARPEYVESADPGTWLLRVWVQPGAKKSGVAGTYQGRLKLRLNAPAVDNKANKALIRYMAELLGLKPRHVRLVSGNTNRGKTLLIESEAEPAWPGTGPDAG